VQTDVINHSELIDCLLLTFR